MLSLFVSVVFLTSCSLFGGKRVSGNGNVVIRQVAAADFENVSASGAVTVYLQQAATTAVSVETDENLQEYLDVAVDGNTLRIQPKSGFNLRPTKELIVRVAAPQFENIGASGASKILGQGNVTGDDLRIDASGASEVQLDVNLSRVKTDLSGASKLRMKGKAEEFSTEASGASEVFCLDLTTEKARLDLSGASNAKITANKQLTIDASGASDVQYRGNADLNQKSSGASSVKKI